MAELRSNVEICLRLEGVGVVILGWVFQTEAGAVNAVLHDSGYPPSVLSTGWLRLPRPDVLSSFAPEASETIASVNHRCGFLALAPLPAPRAYLSTLLLQLTIDESTRPAFVQVTPEPYADVLQPNTLALLRHSARPLLELFRRHGVQSNAVVRELIAALGPEAARIERSIEASASDLRGAVAVDLCLHGSDEGLLLSGWFKATPEGVSRAVLAAGAITLNVLPYLHFLPDDEPVGSSPRRRFVAALPQTLHAFTPPLSLEVEFADRSVTSVGVPLSSGPDAVAALACGLESQTSLALLEAIGEHWSSYPAMAGPESLAQALRPLAREAYENVRNIFEAPGERIAAAIDRALLVPELGVLTVGWLLDPDDRVESLRAHFGGRPSGDLLSDAIRLSRPDVMREFARWLQNASTDRLGFCVLAPFTGRASESEKWPMYYTIRARSGVRWRLRPTLLERRDGNPLHTIRELFELVPTDNVEGLCRHVAPVVETLWKARPESSNAESVLDIGTVPENASVSIIVPIYGRNDFIEYQLSLFADDPDLKDAELIYVIDDPRISAQTVQLCREIYPLYRIPMRLVVGRHNRGFAGANNAAVARARGRLLLLLNSDVMPKRPGWLSELRRQYDSLPGAGALGAKLLFPDGSLQHAGISFERIARYPGLWLNNHPGKGLPANAPARSAVVPVPAVTAACLMVDRNLYLGVGGLDESYILGDFEDSDFCLKLRRAGRQVYCSQSVELFHLERQSQGSIGSDSWRTGLTLYNAWVHTRRWDDSIRQLITRRI